jgi:hypothetical protein
MALSERAESSTASDDVLTQALWRMVRAPVLARAGRLDEAEQMAIAAVALLRDVEAPGFLGDALLDLTAVLQIAGKGHEARAAVAEAMNLFNAKGDRLFAQRALTLQAELARLP